MKVVEVAQRVVLTTVQVVVVNVIHVSMEDILMVTEIKLCVLPVILVVVRAMDRAALTALGAQLGNTMTMESAKTATQGAMDAMEQETLTVMLVSTKETPQLSAVHQERIGLVLFVQHAQLILHLTIALVCVKTDSTTQTIQA